MPIELRHDERVVAAWASSPNGPGWSNQIFEVLIQRCGTTRYRTVAVQPQDFTPALAALHGPGSSMTAAVTAAVGTLVKVVDG